MNLGIVKLNCILKNFGECNYLIQSKYHYYYHFNIVFRGKVCMGSCAPRGVRTRLRKLFREFDKLS